MPNFQKSKGFQLKSGNKAKAPFKMMGSSPAKNNGISGKKEGATGTDINQFAGNSDTFGGITPTEREIVANVPDKETPKPKHRDQVKKQEKITKLEGKEAKRDAKRADGKKVFLGNLKTKNNANKREKLQTEVDKTSEQYTTDKAAKKDADRKKASEIMIGISKNFDPNSNFKSLADQETQQLANKRRKQNIEDYETGKNKDLELKGEKSSKTNEDGTAKITSTNNSTTKVDEENAAKAKASPAEYKRKK